MVTEIVFCCCLFWLLEKVRARFLRRGRLMVILGSGGHTSEMMAILAKVDLSKVTHVDIICTTGDQWSEQKASRVISQPYKAHTVLRSRKVGQSYLTSIFTTLLSIFPCMWVVFKSLPDLIITNGPAVAVPICYSSLLLKLLFIKSPKIMYVESICRVKSLSLSGRLLYPISSSFYVQWEGLERRYQKSKYIGCLV